MAHIQLNVYLDPGALEVTCNLRLNSGSFIWVSAYIDTGAQVSLFPLHLLERLKHQKTGERFIIQQAGIAGQEFEAIEAIVEVSFEDSAGNISSPAEIRAWFADTEEALIGFDGVLDRAILHADLKNGRDAWIEID